jgi:hypothetical protein
MQNRENLLTREVHLNDRNIVFLNCKISFCYRVGNLGEFYGNLGCESKYSPTSSQNLRLRELNQ